MYSVSTLLKQLQTWDSHGSSLMQQGTLCGKFHKKNYKSALNYKTEVHNSLLKRLQSGRTVGPFYWDGDINSINFKNLAINPLGAVPYKDDATRARACDNMFCNDDNSAPYFCMPAM